MTAKPSLDETFDAVFCRPLGNRVAKALAPTRVTANQVTMVSGGLGLLAGVFYAAPGAWPLLGAALFLGMMILDCADGTLAGMRGGGGWKGRVLDGIADFVTAFSVHFGMCMKLTLEGGDVLGRPVPTGAVWVLAALAGASLSWNSGVLDGIKQRLKPGSVDTQLARWKDEPKSRLDEALYRFIVFYAGRIDRAAGRPTEDDAQHHHRVQWVGPTHHHLWMVIAGTLTVAWPNAYLFYFFFAIGPANAYLLYVLARARWVDDRIAA